MKKRYSYFRPIAWTLAIAMSVAVWIVVISAVRPIFA
jgi:hypothetical protein